MSSGIRAFGRFGFFQRPGQGIWNFFSGIRRLDPCRGREGNMARRSQHSFLKRQKEMKRKEEAAEKMARRQGKLQKPRNNEEEEQPTADGSDNQAES
jgi:hypothetical protein